MKFCLCTLVLNEMEWLPSLIKQHIHWDGLERWIFVESADRAYATVNPDMVSPEGLSVDGTTEFLENLSRKDPHVVHIKHGFSTHHDLAQGKCEARQRYLDEMESIQPEFFIILDADEFYPHQVQIRANRFLHDRLDPNQGSAFCFKHREIWCPPSIQQSKEHHRFQFEVIGGFWSIPYCRFWRWYPELKYTNNHNTPTLPDRRSLDFLMKRFDRHDSVYLVHLGFASYLKTRRAKNNYYAYRGEAVDPKRSWYVESRKAFETWEPGTELPNNARVVEYNGLIPECFT